MLDWLKRSTKRPGWLALSLSGASLDYVQASSETGKPTVTQFGSRRVGEAFATPERVARELRTERYRCSTMMAPGEYQLLQVEAPNVPRAEMRAAVRWRVKDLVDYDVAAATVDVLDIPAPEGAPSARHFVFAVSAPNPVIGERIRRFDEAGIALAAIDIPELGQRNLAAVKESGNRGLALAYFAEDWGLLTINYRAELYLARRLEMGLKALAHEQEGVREETLERLLLELQRTFDNFERQFGYVSVEKLLVAPTPSPTGIVAYLAANLAVPVESMDLRELLAFRGEAPDAQTQWRLFHHFGAALRDEK